MVSAPWVAYLVVGLALSMIMGIGIGLLSLSRKTAEAEVSEQRTIKDDLSYSSNTRYASGIRAELRASHAGETGAVWIYRGILLVNRLRRDPEIQQFAQHHLATEKAHLIQFENIIDRYRGSLLLFIWMFAGFAVGVLSAVMGKDWVYYSIYKIESFVDVHYRQQIKLLSEREFYCKDEIITMMESCNADEQDHRDEALSKLSGKPTFVMRIWGNLISIGSSSAVKIAKLI
jgi:ubiquinone biosynthesis monooxygenase Coq7